MKKNTLKFTQLGMTKPVEIRGTVKNIKKTLSLQKEISKSQDIMVTPEATLEDTFEALDKMLDVQLAYVSETLKLTAKQYAMLEDLERDDLELITSEIVAKVFGEETEIDGEDEGKE